MKKLLSLLILLALCRAGIAQTKQSKPENNSTVGVYLETVTHDRAGTLWVGGSVWLLQGFLLRINTAGVKVTLLPKVTTVNRLLFTNRRTAWMIADYKSLYRSTDGGKTWEKRLTADSNLEDIVFVGDSGWLVGWHGIIYSTNNRGNSWVLQPTAMDIELRQVAFINYSHGWAVGPSGLLTTVDGGKTWNDGTLPTLSLRSVDFLDRTHGWAIDANQKWTLVGTDDGGVTWQRVTNVTQTGLEHVFFANSNQGWAVGEAVIHTNDGGRTWLPQPLPKSGFTYSRVAFSDLLNGAAVNIGAMHTDTSGDIIRTSDGGRKWRVVPNTWVRRTTDKVYRAKFPNLVRSGL